MANNKFYAVKVGRNPGIYKTWDSCKEQVNGYQGADYKAFTNLDDAENYINDECINEQEVSKNNSSIEDINTDIEEKINNLSDDEVIAFVDGSYNKEAEKVGFGVIIIGKGREISSYYNSFDGKKDKGLIQLRNVVGELKGVEEALDVATNNNIKHISIYYDYEGIEKWVTGEWKAKKEITKKYSEKVQEKKKIIDIEFVKIPAHSGVYFNEEADRLAKNSILAKGHKTYKDGSVYFVGHTVEDWKEIVDYINSEAESLEKGVESIIIAENVISDTKTRLVISDKKNKVSINIYQNKKSYVQGKQSVLFQKIIATSISFLTNGQTVVETLNSYHALPVKKEELEQQFEKMLPNYRDKYNDKIYSTLLSAIYNTMLTGYMPDYTCLVTPIFRSYEYYLHKILNAKMGLKTTRDNGTNNSGYFEKKAIGVYECNSSAKDKLSKDQLDFLNKFYSNYNSVRHRYSHWSADDVDTAVIDNIAQARELIEKGLNLINEYYKLF